MGPIGPQGIAGTSMSYGTFYTQFEDISVSPGQPVPLNETGVATSNLTMTGPFGVINITIPGDYLLTYGVSLSVGVGTEINNLALALNGSTTVPGSILAIVTDSQMTTCTCIVHVATASTLDPATIEIINRGPDAIILSAATVNAVTGFLTISQLSPLPTP